MKKVLLSLIAACSLSACAPAEYDKSEVATQVFRQILPATAGVKSAAACNTKSEADFAVTVTFDSGDVMHYAFTSGKIVRQWVLTEENARTMESPNRGCYNPDFVAKGDLKQMDYWVGAPLWRGPTVYVDVDIKHAVNFNENERLSIRRFAEVVKFAIKDYAEFVPTEKSWN